MTREHKVDTFQDQRVFLDIKDEHDLKALEFAIRSLGGTIEKFLSKDITCIVTSKIKSSGNASTSKDSPASTLPGIMSRGRSLLLRSNSCKEVSSVCDPVAFARLWDITIVSLDAVLQTIDRLSANSKDSMEMVPIVQKKIKFTNVFIKFEDIGCQFRPGYAQYSTPFSTVLDGDLGNGIFSGVQNLRLVPTKTTSKPCVAAPARKQKTWNKRGYCECCDVLYDDLTTHLADTVHQRFAKCSENFAALDALIHQIANVSSVLTSPVSRESCAGIEQQPVTVTAGENTGGDHSVTELADSARLLHNVEPADEGSSDVAVEPVCPIEVNNNLIFSSTDTLQSNNVELSHPELEGTCQLQTCTVSVADDKTVCTSSSTVLTQAADKCTVTAASADVTRSVHAPQPAKDASPYSSVSDALPTSMSGMLSAKSRSCTDGMPELISSDRVNNLLDLLSSEQSDATLCDVDESLSVTASHISGAFHTLSTQTLDPVDMPSMAQQELPTELQSNVTDYCRQKRPNDIAHCFSFPVAAEFASQSGLCLVSKCINMNCHTCTFSTAELNKVGFNPTIHYSIDKGMLPVTSWDSAAVTVGSLPFVGSCAQPGSSFMQSPSTAVLPQCSASADRKSALHNHLLTVVATENTGGPVQEEQLDGFTTECCLTLYDDDDCSNDATAFPAACEPVPEMLTPPLSFTESCLQTDHCGINTPYSATTKAAELPHRYVNLCSDNAVMYPLPSDGNLKPSDSSNSAVTAHSLQHSALFQTWHSNADVKSPSGDCVERFTVLPAHVNTKASGTVCHEQLSSCNISETNLPHSSSFMLETIKTKLTYDDDSKQFDDAASAGLVVACDIGLLDTTVIASSSLQESAADPVAHHSNCSPTVSVRSDCMYQPTDSSATDLYPADCSIDCSAAADVGDFHDNDSTLEYCIPDLPTVGSRQTAWKVLSVDDCRMRLIRAKLDSISVAESGSSASGNKQWYVKNNCNAGLKLILSRNHKDVLTC